MCLYNLSGYDEAEGWTARRAYTVNTQLSGSPTGLPNVHGVWALTDLAGVCPDIRSSTSSQFQYAYIHAWRPRSRCMNPVRGVTFTGPAWSCPAICGQVFVHTYTRESDTGHAFVVSRLRPLGLVAAWALQVGRPWTTTKSIREVEDRRPGISGAATYLPACLLIHRPPHACRSIRRPGRLEFWRDKFPTFEIRPPLNFSWATGLVSDEWKRSLIMDTTLLSQLYMAHLNTFYLVCIVCKLARSLH
jgi:hypothetical protein